MLPSVLARDRYHRLQRLRTIDAYSVSSSRLCDVFSFDLDRGVSLAARWMSLGAVPALPHPDTWRKDPWEEE